MAVKETLPFVPISLFTASKHIRFLENLKQLRFSGELVFTDRQGQQWSFYLYLGSIMYATGGTHLVRRWQRNLAAYCPQIAAHSSVWQSDLAIIPAAAFKTCWQYQLLCLWTARQKITPEQAAQMIHAVVVEVLFDIAQAMRATYQIKQDNSLSTQLPLIDVQQAIAEVEQLWQAWHKDPVAEYSPNSAPIIKQPAQLKECTSAQVYRTLTYLLNGKRTLRDVAWLMKRDVLQVTHSLLPFIESKLVELTCIPDLPVPVSPPVAHTPAASAVPSGPLVACVDDSPAVCQTMESLLVAAGYRFFAVQDGLRAIATILARKPDLIFLDLVMPNTNGYEICAQLRKLSAFQNTPILILTGNDGIVDRVRAKLVGASDYLNKPVDAGVVLSVIRKHLQQGVTSS
jgi:chemotaxis family two-component system response regulator PixG